jgi:hypothetical protein
MAYQNYPYQIIKNMSQNSPIFISVSPHPHYISLSTKIEIHHNIIYYVHSQHHSHMTISTIGMSMSHSFYSLLNSYIHIAHSQESYESIHVYLHISHYNGPSIFMSQPIIYLLLNYRIV